MPIRSVLPPPPPVVLEMLEDLSPPGQGFLRLRRRQYSVDLEEGSRSEPFLYDEVQRRALDAVVIVPHFLASSEGSGNLVERYVYLRSAVRPPVQMRRERPSATFEPAIFGLWEVPAGLVEPEEESPEGIIACAQRELEEEVGFRLPVDAFRPLGPPTFPCPGVIAERHYFFHVEVDPSARGEPSLDGSVLERVGAVVAVPLKEALRACRDGALADAKTELSLRRLEEVLKG